MVRTTLEKFKNPTGGAKPHSALVRYENRERKKKAARTLKTWYRRVVHLGRKKVGQWGSWGKRVKKGEELKKGVDG